MSFSKLVKTWPLPSIGQKRHSLKVAILFVSVDRSRVGEANVPQGYVIQCIINTHLDFDVIATKE